MTVPEKTSEEGESASVGGVVPVPVSGTIWVPGESTMVRVPVKLPAVVGLKPMENEQSDEAASVLPQLLLLGGRTKGGVTVRLVTGTEAEAVFCTVRNRVEDCDPTSTLPKARMLGAMVTELAGIPVPVSEAVSELGMLPETVTWPVLFPVAAGVK